MCGLRRVTQRKIVFVRNSLSGWQDRLIILFQGTYSVSNDFELANGKDAVLKFSGAGARRHGHAGFC